MAKKMCPVDFLIGLSVGGRKSGPKRSVESVHDIYFKKHSNKNNKSKNESKQFRQAQTLNRK